MPRVRLLVMIGLFLLSSDPALAEEAKQLHWWEIATGIIAIPAAVFGLVVAYATFRKTHLEATKIELEIREKQQAIAASGASEDVQRVARSLIDPLVDNARINYIIVRFILLYLILAFWEVFSKILNVLMTGTFLAWTQLLGMSAQGMPTISFFGGTQIAQFGWIAIVIFVGVPLYRDISRHVGFSLGDMFHLRRQRD
jgi:hypothetical protein